MSGLSKSWRHCTPSRWTPLCVWCVGVWGECVMCGCVGWVCDVWVCGVSVWCVVWVCVCDVYGVWMWSVCVWYGYTHAHQSCMQKKPPYTTNKIFQTFHSYGVRLTNAWRCIHHHPSPPYPPLCPGGTRWPLRCYCRLPTLVESCQHHQSRQCQAQNHATCGRRYKTWKFVCDYYHEIYTYSTFLRLVFATIFECTT